MGQRFQIIENTNGKLKVYHIQWLWGDYAIRRIGTAVRNFIIYNKNGNRSFEEYLKGSFFGKPNDMNNIHRYFSDTKEWNDNKEILTFWRGNKEIKCKTRDFKRFLRTLDNNDGFFYIEFDDKYINGQMGINGYCFMLRDKLEPITAEEYLKNYDRTEGFTKKQQKELEQGKKVFSELKLIKPIKRVIQNDM